MHGLADSGGLISIHAPREGCDDLTGGTCNWTEISIHAPREGCDRMRLGEWRDFENFNPRTP